MNDPLPTSPPFSFWGALWNPFRFIAGFPALALGVTILLIAGGIASLSNTHFDGVLDTHIGFKAPLWFFLSEGIANWLSLAICLWIGGLILKGWSSFRAIDLFGTQALARWPFLLTALVCLLPGVTTYQEKLIAMTKSGEMVLLPPSGPPAEVLSFWGATGIMLIVTVWFVALAWKSFRLSCDVRGWKAVVTFILCLIAAEILSKVVILTGFVALLKAA